ncbi:MAG: alpha/beta hydrolase [Acidobacteriota bacterium]
MKGPHRPAARIALLLAAVLVLFYGGLCAYMFFRQESYVFFPERTLTATPRTLGMAFEDVRLCTHDGVAIHGWYVHREGARGTLVFFHGNAGNLSDRVGKVRLFHDMGLNVLAVDYRGYGESGGIASEEGTYADGAAAVAEAMRRQGDRQRLVFFGESLGGAVGVEAARRIHPGALVLESAFTSIPDMAKTLYPWLPVSRLLKIRYDSLDRMGGLSCPVMVLHSREDEIVPFEMGRRLYERAPGPKVFQVLKGGHNDGGLLASPEAQEVLRRFLEMHLSEPLAAP